MWVADDGGGRVSAARLLVFVVGYARGAGGESAKGGRLMAALTVFCFGLVVGACVGVLIMGALTARKITGRDDE